MRSAVALLGEEEVSRHIAAGVVGVLWGGVGWGARMRSAVALALLGGGGAQSQANFE